MSGLMSKSRLGRRLVDTLIISFPALLVYAVIRIALPDPDYQIGYVPYLVFTWRMARRTPIWEFVPFGVLPLLALLDWGRNRRVLRVYALMLIMVYAQIVIASDTGRLLVAGFAPFLIMSIYGLQNAVRAIRRRFDGKRQ